MEKISWSDRVRNEEVLHRVKEGRNIVHTVKGRYDNCIGHILCRNCFLKYVIEGEIEKRVEVTGRRGRRRYQLERRNIVYTVKKKGRQLNWSHLV